MSALVSKSLTQIRGIAQSYGIKDIFTKEKFQLLDEINTKQQAMVPQPKFAHPPYDARLMTRPPSKSVRANEILAMLQNHMDRGMKFSCDEEHWYMHFNNKDDHGSLRMPMKTLLRCADRILE